MDSDCSLILIAPEKVTEARLISSNVPEIELEWSAETTYSKGARARVAHTVYQSSANDNTGNSPLTNSAFWAEVGPTNTWAAFDGSVSTRTTNPLTISYQLRFGRAITSVNALNTVGATSIRVRVVDPIFGTVYERVVSLRQTPRSASWWQWFFGQRSAQYDASFNDLPTFPNADIYVDIEGSAELGVGVLLFGNTEKYSLGVRYGATVGIQDYSRKERNSFGDTVLVERAYARRASFTMVVRAGEVDALMRRLADLRATPCLWIGSDKYDATKVYGFYKDFDLVIEYHDYSVFSLNLEGLT